MMITAAPQFVGAFKLLRHEESSAGARVAVASTETLEGAAVARAFRQQGLLLGRLRGVISEHVVWDDGLYLVCGTGFCVVGQWLSDLSRGCMPAAPSPTPGTSLPMQVEAWLLFVCNVIL